MVTIVLFFTYIGSTLVFLPFRAEQVGVDALVAFVFQHFWSPSVEEQFYFPETPPPQETCPIGLPRPIMYADTRRTNLGMRCPAVSSSRAVGVSRHVDDLNPGANEHSDDRSGESA